MIWESSGWIMINPLLNDEYEFKTLMLTKNLEVWLYMGHCWLLTFDLTQLIFQYLSNWLSKLVEQGMKFFIDNLEDILGLWKTFETFEAHTSWWKLKPRLEVHCLRRRICLVNSWSSLGMLMTSMGMCWVKREGKFFGTTAAPIQSS